MVLLLCQESVDLNNAIENKKCDPSPEASGDQGDDRPGLGSKYLAAEGMRHRIPVVYKNVECYADEPCFSGVMSCDSVTATRSDVDGVQLQSMLNNNLSAFSEEQHPELARRNNIENWSFSINNSHSYLQNSGRTSSCSTSSSQPGVSIRNSEKDDLHFNNESGKSPDRNNYLLASSSFSPGITSYKHSTPDDTQTAASVSHVEPMNLESLFLSDGDCKYDVDENGSEKIDVRNTFSWHDFSVGSAHRSRSCVSLDESIFLNNEMSIIDCRHVNDVFTAVSSLEQLEREVAGVISDCGEIERCVGALRLHDGHDQVAKRYSLGVADSVIAGDVRLQGKNQGNLSAVSETQSLSAEKRDSGYIWDDELAGVGPLQLSKIDCLTTCSEMRVSSSLPL